jgi:crotonobetainyl-CoA:carnitine CoA-transferase CaiB-like acyl-CoA transferase
MIPGSSAGPEADRPVQAGPPVAGRAGASVGGRAGGPLGGYAVLDLGQRLTAYGSKLLADFGARVTKIEPPGGDEMRRMEPRRGPGRRSLAFAYYHANKRSARLDIGHPAADGVLRRLAADADVIMISPRPGAPLTGLNGETLRLSWAPARAIVLSITPFGLTGPARDWRMTPMTSYAMSGLMYRMGRAEGPPVTVPGQQAWDQAGAHGVVAALAALRARESAGGQLIDIAVHECLSAQDDVILRYSATSQVMGRSRLAGYPPTGTWECRDGQIEFQVHTGRHWAGFVDMLGHPAELSDPALGGRIARSERASELREVIGTLLAARSRHVLLQRGQELGVPCGLLNSPAQFAGDPQMTARGFYVSRPDGQLGQVRMPAPPFRSSPPLTSVTRPAPELGEHDDEVYVAELGYTKRDLADWRETGLA